MSEKKAIIIDDDQLICLTLTRILSSMGIIAVSVNNWTEGQQEIKNNKFDVAFIDIHLPDANGLDLIPKIVSYSPNTKIIVITADTDDEFKQKAIDEGALLVLEKSFSLLEIKKVVKGVLFDYLEKRRHPRLDCNLPLKFSFMEASVPEHSSDTYVCYGIALDIGQSGIRLTSESRIEKGKHIKFFRVVKKNPFSDIFPSNGAAEVIWVKEQNFRYFAGLEYLQ